MRSHEERIPERMKKNRLWALYIVIFVAAAAIVGVLTAAKKNNNAETLLYPVEVDGKWGYINKAGKVVVEPAYAWADEFHDGVAVVEMMNSSDGGNDRESVDSVRYGAIDLTGKMVVKPDYTFITKYTEGVAGAIIADSTTELEYFVLNKEGKALSALPENMQIVSMLFNGSNLPTQSEGMILVQDDLSEKYGYIDRYGKLIIPYQYNEAANFSNGLALVKNDRNQYEYIDKTGKVKIDASKYLSGESFSEGLAAVAVQDKENSKIAYGYIDTKGNMKIEPRYARAYRFSEGLAKVATGRSINEYSIGYIDVTGAYKIGPAANDSYEETMLSEGLAPIADGAGGYRDKEGKLSIAPVVTKDEDNYLKHNVAGDFRDGIAKVSLSDGRIGYIDRTGKYIWSPRN